MYKAFRLVVWLRKQPSVPAPVVGQQVPLQVHSLLLRRVRRQQRTRFGFVLNLGVLGWAF